MRDCCSAYRAKFCLKLLDLPVQGGLMVSSCLTASGLLDSGLCHFCLLAQIFDNMFNALFNKIK